MKKGNDLIVKVGGTAVAASKSCTIQESCETKEAGMKGSGKWKQYIPGRKGWEVSTSFLVGEVTTIKSLMSQTGTKVSLSWQMRDDEKDTMSGEAIVTVCKISGTRGNLVQGSFTFKGTGEMK